MGQPILLSQVIDPSIKVSVSLITYNQVHFIGRAIEGILSQKVDFKFELIIGDDCSTDGTREILLEYNRRFPEIINLILHQKRNEGVPGKINYLSTILAAKGKYIALIDGDDYWTDQFKLQKQVDFLELNPDYTISCHRVHELVNGNNLVKSDLNTSEFEETYTIEDLARENFIHTPSVVFRNGVIKILPEWFMDAPVGDYVFHLLNAKHGKIKYFPQLMGVYRRHENSTWSSKTRRYQVEKWIWVLEKLLMEFEDSAEVNAILKYHLAQYLNKLAIMYLQADDTPNCIHYLKSAFSFSPEFMYDWSIAREIDFKQLFESREYKFGRRLLNPKKTLMNFIKRIKA